MFADMLKGKGFLIIVCSLCFSLMITCNCFAQDSKSIHFELANSTKRITTFPSPIFEQTQQSHTLTTVRFYVHDIQCFERGRLVYDSGMEHFLFDSDVSSSLDISIAKPITNSIDEISFVIGVDSTLQMNGAQSGVLDPIHGMYWTWQSGYIHWKIEATQANGSTSSPLTWHVGGYRAPFNTLRVCRFKGLPQLNQYNFGLDVGDLIYRAMAEVPSSIMSPSQHAMTLADIFQSCIQWQQ